MRTFLQKSKTMQPTTPTKSSTFSRTRVGRSHDPNSVLNLQRTIGNQALSWLLKDNVEERNAVLTGTVLPRFGHDFARVLVGPSKVGALQTKLAINEPGDEYEQEAERVAEQVMHVSEPQMQHVCPCGGGCPKCQEEGMLQRTITRAVHGVDNWKALRQPQTKVKTVSDGQPLTNEQKAFFEPRFGVDFSRVRVHTDARAAESAAGIHSRAYALGRDIVFGDGQYMPHTDRGFRLLAHELTHVVQQGEAGPRVEAGLVAPSPWRGVSVVPMVQRSPLPPPPPPSRITAAAQIGQHVGLVRRAVERLAVLAGPGTFGPAIVPVLRPLVDGLTYRLGSTEYFGASLEIGIPGRVDPFRLRLVLDDKPDPWERGYFRAEGNRGSIALNLNAPTGEAGAQPLARRSVDEVAALLHHEAIHMFRYWRSLPGARLPFSGGHQAAMGLVAVRGILPGLEANLRTILREVNPARLARGAAAVPEARAADFAEFLAEEAMVRGETSYMATLGRQREQMRAGSSVITGALSVLERGGGVIRYLFGSGSLLDQVDERALGDEGRRVLAAAGRALEEIERLHHRTRWGAREEVTSFAY